MNKPVITPISSRILYIILCISTLATLPILAQPPAYYFDNMSMEDGLSNSYVNCILQDSKGWMWFGTSQGLNRFDGEQIKEFKSGKENHTSLAGNIVRTIFEDSDKNLWIGTEGGGLNLFDRASETFLHPNHLVDAADVNSIVESKKKELWIGTNNGLYLINVKIGRSICYKTKIPVKNSLSNNFVRRLKLDPFGKLWIGTSHGLDCFDPETEVFEHINLPSKQTSDFDIWELYIDTLNRLWVGTYSSGMYIINLKTKAIQSIPITTPQTGVDIGIKAISYDNKGNYWVGTRDGLFIYNSEGKLTQQLNHDIYNNKSLIHNSILNIFKDIKGDLWIGSRGGISHMITEKQIYKHYSASINNKGLLNNNEIYAFYTDPEQNVWVGTGEGGLNILNHKTQQFEYYNANSPAPKRLNANGIKAIIDDNNGNVWLGLFRKGINIINRHTRAITSLSNNPSNKNSLGNNNVWALLRDSQGQIWVGHDDGLDRYDARTQSFVHYPNVASKTRILWLAEDKQHQLWMGTKFDVVVYNDATKKTKHFDTGLPSYSFCQDHKNQIWITTDGNGVYRYAPDTGLVPCLSKKMGLAGDFTYKIIEDNRNQLWITTSTGLSNYNPQTQKIKNYYKADGFQNNQYYYGAGYKDALGNLYFGGNNGFTSFNPDNLQHNHTIPKIVLTELRLFNTPIKPNDTENPYLSAVLSETKYIELPYSKNNISFDFLALNYIDSHNNAYKYKLEGFDSNWISCGTKHQASYSNLPAGNYTFRVIGSNNDDVWNSEGVSIQIKIQRPWWLRFWFVSTICIIVLVSFLVMYRMRILHYQKQQERLSFLVKERTSELEKINQISEAQAEELKAANEVLVDKNKLIETQASTLSKTNQQLILLNSTKDRLFSVIAHDLKNPFHLVAGFSDLLLRDFKKYPIEKIEKFLTLINTSAKNGSILLDNLLQWSRSQSGRLTMDPTILNVYSIVEEILEMTITEANQKNINIKNEIIENLQVFADENMIKVIIRNLVSNAVKFTGNGGEINISAYYAANETFIKVTDTGIGIPPENMKLLFSVDSNITTRGTANESGTGLGLILCREFVDKQGGRIWVESTPGAGSTFIFSLPQREG